MTVLCVLCVPCGRADMTAINIMCKTPEGGFGNRTLKGSQADQRKYKTRAVVPARLASQVRPASAFLRPCAQRHLR